MLRPSNKVVENENQISRNLRSRSKCKKPLILADFITERTKKGKAKAEIVKEDDDDDCVLQSPSKKKKIPTVDQNIVVRRLRVGKCMTVPDAEKLKVYLAKRENKSPLWHGVKSGVFVKDVLAFLNEEAVGVQAMDAYLEILSHKHPEQGDPVSLFMSTFDWDDMKGGDRTAGVEAYCEPLFNNVCIMDFVFLPIIHKKQHRFTLLVLNKELQRWEHYNTQRPKQTTLVDPCFEDASRLHVEISKHLAFVKDNGKSIIKNKMIWKHVKRQGHVKLFTFKLSNKDRDLLTWLGRNNVDHFPIISSKDCPKQDPSNVDSGIAVTYTIKRLSEGLELESTFKKGAMTQQRAHVLGRFLNDNMQ